MNQEGFRSGVWAVVGLLIAAAGFDSVNDDARLLVLGATVVGVGAALLAAHLLLRGRARLAGLCLVVSVVTPTWFAAALNLLPLATGLILLSGRLPPTASRCRCVSTRRIPAPRHRPRRWRACSSSPAP